MATRTRRSTHAPVRRTSNRAGAKQKSSRKQSSGTTRKSCSDDAQQVCHTINEWIKRFDDFWENDFNTWLCTHVNCSDGPPTPPPPPYK